VNHEARAAAERAAIEKAPLAVCCGGGAFPAAVADALERSRHPFVMLPIRGLAEPSEVERFPHEWVQLGAMGKFLAILKKRGCRELMFVGIVHRPALHEIRLDWTTIRVLPRYLRAQRGGDDTLLSEVARTFEAYGVRVRGIDEVAPEILVPRGVLGRHRPGATENAEIALGRRAIAALGALDIGQAVVAVGNRIVAVEAAEGTAAMLDRVGGLRRNGRLHDGRGVLVKAAKPGQDRRIDLPAVGPDTVKQAAAAGLAGIAVEAGATIVADAGAVLRAADAGNIFVIGFEPGPHP
jgi:DUF1009 family protein